MAYKKITDLQEATEIADEDLLEVVTDTTGTPTSKSLKISTVEDWVKTFAAQESTFKGTIGNIMSPLLDLPLKNSLAMKAGVGSVHFERSTTATYVDRYGVVQTANIDEPRFEEEGLLIEGASTNLLTYSQEFDNATWVPNTLTLDSTTESAPDGTNTACKVTISANPVGDNLHQDMGITLSTGDWYTISAWLKGDGVSSCRIGFYEDWNNPISHFETITPTTEWKRYSCSAQIQDDTNNVFSVQPIRANNTPNAVFYIWGVQIEKLPFASSYIPTIDVAVTRADEYCSITRLGNDPNPVSSRSVACEVITYGQHPARNTYIINLSGYNFVKGANCWNPGNLTIIPSSDGNNRIYIPWFADQNNFNIKHKFVGIADNENCFIYIDGELKGQSNITPGSALPLSSYDIFIGGNNYNTAKPSKIHIKNLKIYDKCLTPLEVSLL